MSDDGAQHPSGSAAQRPLALWIRRVLALEPQRTALTFEGTAFPWALYSQALADLDALLASHPDAHRIGVVLRNRPGPLAAVIATVGTGRELVTLSPHLGDAGLAKDIADLAPDVLVAEEEDWSRGPLLAAAGGNRPVALTTGPSGALTPRAVPWVPEPPVRPPSGIAVLMMTSGTTGHPKRVELTYDRLTAAFRAGGLSLEEEDQPRLRDATAILWASLAHISGLYFAIAYVVEGRSVAMLEKFDVDDWVELVKEHRPRFIRLAPAAIRMVLQANVAAEVFEGIRAVGTGTAPLPVELEEEFEHRYGVPILTTYGATEFAGAIAGWTLEDKKEWGLRKRGSVGRPRDGIDLRIIDEQSDQVLAPGAIGLLEARGAQLPTEGGGWLRTTDLASVDEDGFLFIHGRSDEAINRGGFKIPPSVIEDALRDHPAVNEASVVALHDARLGQVPAVAVTLSGPATEEELMEFLTDRLARYQRPVALKVVDELPRSPSLKISRELVRQRYFNDMHEGGS